MQIINKQIGSCIKQRRRSHPLTASLNKQNENINKQIGNCNKQRKNCQNRYPNLHNYFGMGETGSTINQIKNPSVQSVKFHKSVIQIH